MKIIKLALLLMIVGMGLFSCSKEDDIDHVVLENDYLEFKAQGGTQSITFTINGGDWFAWKRLDSKGDWCSFTPSEGKAGKNILYVTVEPNNGASRSVTIEINSNGFYKHLFVEQQGVYNNSLQ